MRRVSGTVVLLAVLAACSSAYRRADGLFKAGDLGRAADAYEAALAAAPADQDAPRALFRLGVARATPGTSAFDLAKAREAFQELVDRYPGSEYAREASVPLALMVRVTKAEEEAGALRAQLAKARDDAEAAGKASREDLEQSQAQVQQLRLDLAQQEQTIARLKAEMDQLKHIDLGRTR